MKRRCALLLSTTVLLALCAAGGVWLHIQQRQYARNRQLIDAMVRNDANNCLALVNAGADPNTRIPNTPITPSPTPTFKKFLNQLLHPTSQVAYKPPTAFMIACGSPWMPSQGDLVSIEYPEDLTLLEAMLSHGADINANPVGYETALQSAVSRERLHTVELLLRHGADVRAKGAYGWTPLMSCGENHHPDIVRVLVAHGANPNTQDENGETVIYRAIEAREGTEIVAELLKQGADPNWRDKENDTPLRIAQKMKRPDLVRLLQQHGAK